VTLNAYETLGVWPEASEREIRAAHRSRVEACERRAELGDGDAEQERARLDEALRVLVTPGERALHDHLLRGGSAVPVGGASTAPPEGRPVGAERPQDAETAAILAFAGLVLLVVPLVPVVASMGGGLSIVDIVNVRVSGPLVAGFVLGCLALARARGPLEAGRRARLLRRQGRDDETVASLERWAAREGLARRAELLGRGVLTLDVVLWIWWGLFHVA
jgi:curved DNA-binding protein CbpA